MKVKKIDISNTVLINATNIGYKFSGIGVYSLKLLMSLASCKTNLNFIVILNKSAKSHFRLISFPNNFKIFWITSLVSPDNKFPGHLLRLLYSNYLSLKYFNYLQFNTSQLEINFFKRKQIVTIHDVIPLIFKQYHKKQWIYFKLILQWGLKRSERIITPSFHSKDMILSIYDLPPEKIQVIYHGIDHDEKDNLVTNSKCDFLLYIGRICRLKNIHRLIESFYLIKNEISHKLVIVGDNEHDYKKELKLVSSDPAFERRVVFLKDISEEEKKSLIKNASLFLFPSLFEGFGFTPLEAMANGCPVITSNNSSLPEVCGDAVIFVNPENTNEISNAVLKLLNDDSLKQSLILKGLKRAQKFDWEKSALEYLTIFNGALSKSKCEHELVNEEYFPILKS